MADVVLHVSVMTSLRCHESQERREKYKPLRIRCCACKCDDSMLSDLESPQLLISSFRCLYAFASGVTFPRFCRVCRQSADDTEPHHDRNRQGQGGCEWTHGRWMAHERARSFRRVTLHVENQSVPSPTKITSTIERRRATSNAPGDGQ